MNDERTSKELADEARDELARRADESAVYKRALEILASDGGLWSEVNAAKRLRAALREARKELGL